jgi:hypothetical protein
MDNVVMPDLDPASVIEAVAGDPLLRAFIGHGRIEAIPARQSRRRLLLDKIAQAFELGERYSERRVSLFLGAIHADYAALRRYLVDEEFLSRSDGQYWRSGGSVFPAPGAGAPGLGAGPPRRDGRRGGGQGVGQWGMRQEPGGADAGNWRRLSIRGVAVNAMLTSVASRHPGGARGHAPTALQPCHAGNP